MSLRKFKELLLKEYDKLLKLGYEVEYPNDDDILMWYLSMSVFREFEIKQLKRLDRQV